MEDSVIPSAVSAMRVRSRASVAPAIVVRTAGGHSRAALQVRVLQLPVFPCEVDRAVRRGDGLLSTGVQTRASRLAGSSRGTSQWMIARAIRYANPAITNIGT